MKPDNYSSCSSWIDCTPIDLHSRHPLIKEQDFLQLTQDQNAQQWDIISLSLVVNFVPSTTDRGMLLVIRLIEYLTQMVISGKMLSMAHSFLRQDGYLFLAVSHNLPSLFIRSISISPLASSTLRCQFTLFGLRTSTKAHVISRVFHVERAMENGR